MKEEAGISCALSCRVGPRDAPAAAASREQFGQLPGITAQGLRQRGAAKSAEEVVLPVVGIVDILIAIQAGAASEDYTEIQLLAAAHDMSARRAREPARKPTW